VIDEVSMYNRALAQSEVQAIYAAGALGKCVPNRPPSASNVVAGAWRNIPASIPFAQFMLSASDPDNDSLVVTSVSANSTNGGSVVLSSTEVVYTPAKDYTGEDCFTYTVSDGHGGNASALVLITVRSQELAARNMLPPAPVVQGLQVRFVGLPGCVYEIQRASSLAGPWTTIGTATAAFNGVATFEDTNAPAGNRFYRTAHH